jgi:RNA polymerase sigma-70 factor, ECF subfamily
MRAFARRAAYRADTSSALPWLLGIATHVGADQRRQEARQLRAYAALAAQTPNSDGGEPAVNVSLRRALADALVGLRAGDRDALLLLAWGDLSYAEIASALQIPIGTVRSRINRARQQLGDALAFVASRGETVTLPS